MSEQENVRIAKIMIERLNRRELDFQPEYEREDAIDEGPGSNGPMTIDQRKRNFQGFVDAFPNLHFEPLETIAQGNYVVVNWRATGTHSGPMRAPSGDMIPPTKRKAVVDGSTTFEFRGGKVARTKGYWDMASLMVQLGLMPQANRNT